jgi:hypothetical protein
VAAGILTTKADHNDMRSDRTQADSAMTKYQASDGIGQATRGLQAEGHYFAGRVALDDLARHSAHCPSWATIWLWASRRLSDVQLRGSAAQNLRTKASP